MKVYYYSEQENNLTDDQKFESLDLYIVIFFTV